MPDKASRIGPPPAVEFNHVGIAVRDAAEALWTFQDLFGVEPATEVRMGYDGSFQYRQFTFGGARFEFIEPKDEETFLTKFLEWRGEAMHHVTLNVDDLEATVAYLESKRPGIIAQRFEHPRIRIAFLRPKLTHGVLIELFEHRKPAACQATD